MSDPGNVMGLWKDEQRPVRYGQDDVTYELGMSWLDEACDTVEDWGCGPGYAKRFLHRASYWGIDGTGGKGVDEVADLRYHHSSPDGIFMRHVLEHNWNWDQVLTSALFSFQKRMVLVMFTPFAGHTHVIEPTADYLVPDISFRKEDLLDFFGALLHHEADLVTGTQYGVEHVFFLTCVEPVHPDPGEPEIAAGQAAGHPDTAG